jgi:hypothetical protein
MIPNGYEQAAKLKPEPLRNVLIVKLEARQTKARKLNERAIPTPIVNCTGWVPSRNVTE